MAREVQQETLDKVFTKGFVYDKGTNKIPYHYASIVENIRITNSGITKRNGFSQRYSESGAVGQGITANIVNDLLLYVHDGELYTVDPDLGAATSIGDITSTQKARFLNYGSYTIIFTGDQRPFWHNGQAFLTFDANLVASNTIDLDLNGTAMTSVAFNASNNTTLDDIATQLETDFPTLVQSASRNGSDDGVDITPVPGSDLVVSNIAVTGGASQATGSVTRVKQVTSGELDADINPSFGEKFAGFTAIDNAATPNLLRVSAPISSSSGNVKDWKASGSADLELQGKIQGMAGTLSRLRIFTDKSIEYVDRSSVATTGALTSFFPIIFGDGEPLASPDLVGAAGDMIFFMTKTKKIRVIGYQGAITEPQIKTISDIKGASIQQYLDEQLADDQSKGFLFYDRQRKLIKFFLVSKDSATVDRCIVRDVVEQTRLLDLDKYYGGITQYLTKVYAMSALSRTIYEDEVGLNDNGQGIQWKYTTQAIGLGSPIKPKKRRGFSYAGQINNACKLETKMYVDDKLVFTQVVDGSVEASDSVDVGIGAEEIGGIIGQSPSIEQLEDFEKDVTLGRIRYSGRKVRRERSGTQPDSDFVLDYLDVKYIMKKRTYLKQKKFSSSS